MAACVCNTFAGNVGIGTLTTTAARLQINGVGQNGANPNPAGPGVVPCLVLAEPAACGGLGGMVAFGAGVGQFASIKGLMDVSVGNTTGHIVFCTRGGQSDAMLNERLRIRSNGNVGIGTSSPATKLDAAGTIRSTTRTDPASGEGAELAYDGHGHLLAFARPSGGYRRLNVDGAPLVMNLASQSGVGVGIDSPQAKLHVAGASTPGVTALRVSGPPVGQGYTAIIVSDLQVQGAMNATGNIAPQGGGKVYGAVYN